MSQSMLNIEASVDNLALIRLFIQEATAIDGVDPFTIADILLAANEAVTNIIQHGYQGQPGMIEIEVICNQHAATIYLRDQAPLFDPTTVPPPNLKLALQERALGGVGVYMTTQLMDEVRYCVTPHHGNELTLIKYWQSELTSSETL